MQQKYFTNLSRSPASQHKTNLSASGADNENVTLLSILHYHNVLMYYTIAHSVLRYLKKNQSTPRPSEHPPVMGDKMSKRLGGIKGCKYKTSSWHLNRFPDADNIGSTV